MRAAAVAILAMLLFPGLSPGAEILGFQEFLKIAAEKDTEFETLLLDELANRYQKKLRLPAGDLIVAVKAEHEAYLEADRDAVAMEASLTKLFPMTGTTLAATYETGTSFSSAERTSSKGVSLSQPILENAFGRSTRLLDKIVGLEMEVARHQIIEAYEDYLAFLMSAYHDWHEAHENLAIGRSSYQENLVQCSHQSLSSAVSATSVLKLAGMDFSTILWSILSVRSLQTSGVTE